MTFIKKLNPKSKSFISTNLNFSKLERWGDTKVTFIKDNLEHLELPIIAVKCYMLIRKKLLLVKDNKRGWDVPGGHVKKNESPENAAKRELREEANCYTDSLILLGYLLCSNKGKENKYPKDSLVAIYGSRKFSINLNKKLIHETFDFKLTKLNEIEKIHHNWTELKESIVDFLIKTTINNN